MLRSWRWTKVCPKHVKLILEINKTVIVASSWFLYYLTYTSNHFTFCVANGTITNKSAFKRILRHSQRYCLLLVFYFSLGKSISKVRDKVDPSLVFSPLNMWIIHCPKGRHLVMNWRWIKYQKNGIFKRLRAKRLLFHSKRPKKVEHRKGLANVMKNKHTVINR